MIEMKGGHMASDWLWGLAGGLMIGVAASLYLVVNGRIMGASGIIGGLADRSVRGGAAVERTFFIAGLILVPAVLAWAKGGQATHLTPNLVTVIAAGLLVGLGTRLARGCTSGHGVCGLSRLNPRGVAATGLYLAAGFATVALSRHVLNMI
jgi:uncharacterized protein